MSDKEIHRDYIKNNALKEVKTFGIHFQSEEISFLTKFFNWGLGLVNGELSPVSKEQEGFVLNYNTHIKYNSIPPNNQDQWYIALNDNQKTWVRYYYIKELQEKINDYSLNKDSDSIFLSEDEIDGLANKGNKSTSEETNDKFCANCKNFKGYSEHQLCSSCRFPNQKKKLKRGSITSNRASFGGTKWNDDKHRENPSGSSLDRRDH